MVYNENLLLLCVVAAPLQPYRTLLIYPCLPLPLVVIILAVLTKYASRKVNNDGFEMRDALGILARVKKGVLGRYPGFGCRGRRYSSSISVS